MKSILSTGLLVWSLVLNGCTKKEPVAEYTNPACLDPSRITMQVRSQTQEILQDELLKVCELNERSWTGNFSSFDPQKTTEIRYNGVVYISKSWRILYQPNGRLSEIQNR